MRSYDLYLKPKMALTNDTSVFLRVGLAHTNITASTAGAHKASDFAYGVGIQTNFNSSLYGQIDYMNYFDHDNFSAKGFTVSLGARF